MGQQDRIDDNKTLDLALQFAASGRFHDWQDVQQALTTGKRPRVAELLSDEMFRTRLDELCRKHRKRSRGM